MNESFSEAIFVLFSHCPSSIYVVVKQRKRLLNFCLFNSSVILLVRRYGCNCFNVADYWDENTEIVFYHACRMETRISICIIYRRII